MTHFALSLSQGVGVKLAKNIFINCILWADDIILLSDSEGGLTKLPGELETYSDMNPLKVHTDKMKCMIFNKTGPIR